MKKTLITSIIFLLTFSLYSQEIITSAKLTINLPNDKWSLNNKTDQNGTQVYIFKREPIIDSIGRQIIPNIAVIVEDIDPNLDVVTYSAFKRSKTPFNVLKVFIHGDGYIDFKNAIGYKGTYTDRIGDHTIYMVYLINNKKGIQMIFDVLTCIFKETDPEFLSTLKSIKKNK
jgi:hypothetical protein